MRLRWVAATLLITSGAALAGVAIRQSVVPAKNTRSTSANQTGQRSTQPTARPTNTLAPITAPKPGATQTSATPAAVAPTSTIPAVPTSQPGNDEDPPDDDTPVIPSGPVVVSILKETWIYASPNFKAQKIGYLRAGAMVSRSEKPVGYGACEKGWYKVQPRGYVCHGQSVSLDTSHPVAEISRKRADRTQGLPYFYGMSKFPTPPFYLKLPSPQEQRMVESDLPSHATRASKTREIASVRDHLDEIPAALKNGGIVPSLTPNHHGPGALYNGRAVPRSGFAMTSRFEWEGRVWGLTTDMAIVPLDRMKTITPSGFHGVHFGDGGFPAAFVRSRGDRYYKKDEKTGGMTADAPIPYREGILLTGNTHKIDSATYYETRDGRYIRNHSRVVMIEGHKEWPQWANEGKKWIDISILKQSLVAYEGTRPVYATLVSTGADGLGDPKETHSTVRGTFLIHTKHVTVTMDSDEAEDQFDLRDVPYVQYFHEGYALHAAYWHDEFGTPRSHGCVNLHPTDAAWLFGWTTPDVPADWHGALTLKQGTIVHIHP